MKKNIFTKVFAGTLATLMAVTPAVSVPVFAAPGTGQDSTKKENPTNIKKDLTNSDIIDYSKTGSLTIYKYDITSAEAAGDYTEGERIANGERDEVVEQKMADYAIQGVQFTYLRVGNIETYSNTKGGQSQVNVVYEIPTKLADILELDADDAYKMNEDGVAEKCTKKDVLHYDSTQLNDALAAILNADTLGARSALEEYLYSYGIQDDASDGSENTDLTVNGDSSRNVSAVSMPETDENGYTHVEGLELGLYLLVETEVPEQVTDTVNPWFVSLPFTNITPDDVANSTDDGATGTEGGDYWLYDMTCYPKNQTGNPTLDKSVRNAYSNTNAVDDKNGTVNRGDRYDANTGLVVYNDDSNNTNNEADKDDATYVANRGGYTVDGQTAGKGGADYSYDYAYRDTTTASAGDVLDYILVSKLPHITSKSTFLSEYTFRDILSGGLTYNDDVKIAFYDNPADANANNTVNAKFKWDLTSDNYSREYADVKVTDGNSAWRDGSWQLTVQLTEAGLQVINGEGVDGNNVYGDGAGQVSNNSYSDMYMVVYYTVTVNSDDSLVLGDNGNENDVVLTWQRTSDGYYNTLEDRNYVYAYSLDLTKQFSDGKGDMNKVAFKLYNSTDAYYVTAIQEPGDTGVWYVTGKTVSKDDAATFVPNDDGKIVIYGLEADKYAMTEITTDNGYTLLEDAINVVITPTDREVNASVAGTTGMDEAAINAIVQYYHGGIYDENGDLVTDSHDYVKDTDGNRPGPISDGARPEIQTPDGRTINKTDMYVGEIKPATATVDDVDATMKAHTYTEGEGTQQFTSENATVFLNVVNNTNFLLPQTGGYGTILFTLAGCAVAVGGVLLITKKSKKKEA